MKKCPFCAEEIQDEAVICRFCKFDLNTGKPVETKGDLEVKAKSSIDDGVRLGVGMFIKLPLIILGTFILVFSLVASFISTASAPSGNDTSVRNILLLVGVIAIIIAIITSKKINKRNEK